jgi:hypothetical protein
MKRIVAFVASVAAALALLIPVGHAVLDRPRPSVASDCIVGFQTQGLPAICMGDPFPQRL